MLPTPAWTALLPVRAYSPQALFLCPLPVPFICISSIPVYRPQISWNFGVLAGFICFCINQTSTCFYIGLTSFPSPSALQLSLPGCLSCNYSTASLELTPGDLATL